MHNENIILKISQLTRRFDDQIALDNISLDVEKGQVFGIVGENGAGKTTLIKHLLGQYIAQQGSVRLFGLDPVAEPEKVLTKIAFIVYKFNTSEEFKMLISDYYPTISISVFLVFGLILSKAVKRFYSHYATKNIKRNYFVSITLLMIFLCTLWRVAIDSTIKFHISFTLLDIMMLIILPFLTVPFSIKTNRAQ